MVPRKFLPRKFLIGMLLCVVLSLVGACQPIVAQTGKAVATTAANKEFVLRYFAALNKDKSAATVDAYMADEVLKGHINFFEAVFPVYQLKAEEMIAEGDQVFVRTTFTGTHKGKLGNIAPTNKPVTFSIALTYRSKNGKIVDHWMLADQLTMMQQLGVIPVD